MAESLEDRVAAFEQALHALTQPPMASAGVELPAIPGPRVIPLLVVIVAATTR